MAALENWLRLWHTPGVGPKTFNHLLSIFKDPACIYNSSYSTLLEAGITQRLAKTIVEKNTDDYLADIEWMNSSDQNTIVTIHSSRYPMALRHICHPPPILYVSGCIEVLNDPLNIAIVGSRKSTHSAQQLAYRFSQKLSSLGFVIVSGLARGIDSQAHQGAISSNKGKTIAVYANGLDLTYPRSHKQLANKIIGQGALVSEFSPGTKPLPQHFPQRNRIISGLSLGVIIIEAAVKSGTLITARYALEQGREVFAVPGEITNPLNLGCHRLIQEGATLVTGINDILTELKGPLIDQIQRPETPRIRKKIPPRLENLLAIIDYCPMPMEIIITKSGLTAEQVSSMLTELEIGGYVISDAYGQYSRSNADFI